MTRSSALALVAVTAAGRRVARQLDAGLAHETVIVDRGSAAESLRTAFDDYAGVVAVLAAGAVVRILAPQIAAGDKATDPAVLVVDEAGRYVVPLLGGHAAHANRLADELAAVLGAQPVPTTATDATGLPGLDDLGWPASGDIAGVTRRLLDGEPITVVAAHRWPLPSLGPDVRYENDTPTADIVITDHDVEAAPGTVVLHPPSLVAGMGASRGVSVDEAGELLAATLTGAGLAMGSLAAIASVDLKADEAGLVELAERLGVPWHASQRQVIVGTA